jgi:hypothetical protein
MPDQWIIVPGYLETAISCATIDPVVDTSLKQSFQLLLESRPQEGLSCSLALVKLRTLLEFLVQCKLTNGVWVLEEVVYDK